MNNVKVVWTDDTFEHFRHVVAFESGGSEVIPLLGMKFEDGSTVNVNIAQIKKFIIYPKES